MKLRASLSRLQHLKSPAAPELLLVLWHCWERTGPQPMVAISPSSCTAQVSGSSGTAAPECSVPPSTASHSSRLLCEGRCQTELASTPCQPDTRIANWRRTCQQGDFIWGVSLSSPLPFLFWMPLEQLSVQVFVITQALLFQPFVFGGVAHCLDLLSLVICAKKFVRSLHVAVACAHYGAGMG